MVAKSAFVREMFLLHRLQNSLCISAALLAGPSPFVAGGGVCGEICGQNQKSLGWLPSSDCSMYPKTCRACEVFNWNLCIKMFESTNLPFFEPAYSILVPSVIDICNCKEVPT